MLKRLRIGAIILNNNMLPSLSVRTFGSEMLRYDVKVKLMTNKVPPFGKQNISALSLNQATAAANYL
jgi:hypothetical protein